MARTARTARNVRTALTAPLLIGAVLLGACRTDDTPVPETAANTATAPQSTVAPVRTVAAPVVVAANPESNGHVVAISPITEQAPTSGAGAVVGGVLGGVLGHQVGGGDGRKAATVLGAVGGAVVGNRVEKNRSTHVVGYRVSVRTDAGGVREFQRSSVNDLSVGTNVRIVNGGVQPA
jgi:outer membrane lipoprotein SlyB